MAQQYTKLVGYTIPNGTSNPFAYVQHRLVLEMYPPFASGFKARTVVLLTLQSLVILMSLIYIPLQLREQKRHRRDIWVVRLIERPQGRYIVLNQYLLYPIFSIVVATLWIALTCYVWEMFGQQGNPVNLFYWTGMMWIPLYLHLALTTLSVLSAANLASKGSKPNTHMLPPWAANGLFVLFIPVVVGGILGTGIWAGSGWYSFGESWLKAYNALGVAAEDFSPTADTTLEQGMIKELLENRLSEFHRFVPRQRAATWVYVASASLLIIINLVGGFKLLATLRRVSGAGLIPADTPIVAPLAPFSDSQLESVPDYFNRTDLTIERELTVKDAGDRLKRLEWDTILYFLAVVPACTAFIVYSVWLTKELWHVLSSAILLEFACLGMVWIYTALVAGSLLAMILKLVLTGSTSQAEKRRAAIAAAAVNYNDSINGARPNRLRKDEKDLEWDMDDTRSVSSIATSPFPSPGLEDPLEPELKLPV
ncbi:hypothetical protein T439DRAFT_108401 [Meredithblackwellia eburnea MCA 4105]